MTERDCSGESAGQIIVRREVWRDQPWSALPLTVISDDGDLLAAHVGAGTPHGFVEAHPLGVHAWSVRTHWQGPDVVMLHRAGDAYSVWFFGPLGTYINLQDPYRRTEIGFDTFDHELDIVVAPEGGGRSKTKTGCRSRSRPAGSPRPRSKRSGRPGARSATCSTAVTPGGTRPGRRGPHRATGRSQSSGPTGPAGEDRRRRYLSTMPVPQQISIVTIGARDFRSMRAFYGRWGWNETNESSDYWCAFDVGGWLMSLYPLDALGEEAAPGTPVPEHGWNGVTFAINVGSEDELHSMFDDAVAAGAEVIAPVTRREWGGISGYVADPEGNRWELAVSSSDA